MKSKKLITTLAILSLLFIALFQVGCEKQTTMEPVTPEKITLTNSQMKFLHPQQQSFKRPFYTAQWITKADGGLLRSGDEYSGISGIKFYPNALPQDTLIEFSWDSQGFLTDLAPHGIWFNNTVILRLSYKEADLTNINEDNLRIWYFNEETNLWELVGGTVNKDKKYVQTEIQHFSRYAIGDMP
ncbi:MAG: hypothetical protein Kow0037_11200 [Calditrichia bacterium]